MRVGYIFAAIAIVLALGICLLEFPEGVGAIVVLALGSAVALPIFLKTSSDGKFILRIFFAGLAVRVVFGLLVYFFQAQEFFGPDAIGYDYKGALIADYWRGLLPFDSPFLTRAMTTSGTGWGMNYLVGAIYFVLGKNALAAMAFCWVIGGLIGPAVHSCAHKIFKNTSVARLSSVMTAFFPAFIIWSGQLIKDGLIIFLLVIIILAVLKLQEKFSIESLVILVLAMFGVLSLRFYIFYMIAIAVVGTFVIGLSNTPGAIARRAAVLIIVGFGLTYLGVLRTATVEIEQYGNLERLQRSRVDMARSGESGFGEDVDISTTEGALSAIPLGFAYLMFAPFPWQATNLRQAITLPEVLLWWAMMPLMISGIIYTVRNRLREAFPALFFSLMLTLAYSIFQGNVGTAYRQRTQIQVFLFMFIAVGWVLRREAKENKQIIAKTRRRQMPAPTAQI